MQPTDLANLRRSYLQSTLSEADLAPDPVSQFVVWFAEVRDAGIVEPNALVLGTAGSDARPTARTVLLKDVDERGFTVYTNYSSRKGHDIAANPWVSMLFPWHAVERQVIVTGRAEWVSRAESAAYFASRPYGSRIGALASPQSSVIGSRTELEERYATLAQRYPEGTRRTAARRLGWLADRPRRDGVLAGSAEPAPRPAALRPRSPGRSVDRAAVGPVDSKRPAGLPP